MLTTSLLIALLQVSATPQTAQPAVAAKANDLEKVICRKIPRTGSIAQKDKICMTGREWRQQADAARGVATTMQDASNR